MSAPEEDTNPYELLGLSTDATDADIRKAYRQKSLKVHPDRNPNNPDAAKKFHELNQGYELLLDPLRRMALDAKLRIKAARAERWKSYDNKRKNLVDELEEREKAFKKARMDKAANDRKAMEENERVKEEGKRLREQKEREVHDRWMPQTQTLGREEASGLHGVDEDEDPPPSLDPLDTTVRIKYSLKTQPTLTTSSAIANFLSKFGETDVDSIVLSLKASKSKSSKTPDAQPKSGTALVPFKQIGDAFAAVCASGRADLGLDGVNVSWVGGNEPAILGWLKRKGMLGNNGASKTKHASPAPPAASSPPNVASSGKEAPATKQEQGSTSTPFSSFPSTFPDAFSATPVVTPNAPVVAGLDFESVILMRMRQAERERLEREILEQEANET